VRYSEDCGGLTVLEPLWDALQDYHSQVLPSLAGKAPSRSPREAWRLRRALYEHLLRSHDTFVLVAEVGGRAVGYAFVTVRRGLSAWKTGDRVAELQTLSVLPEYRGQGLGGVLLEVLWRRLADRGVEEMSITTAVTNLRSHHFYEKHGFQQGFVVYYGRRPQP
jgi:ribosomal protein S18 acetylase RimI-like enzyme